MKVVLYRPDTRRFYKQKQYGGFTWEIIQSSATFLDNLEALKLKQSLEKFTKKEVRIESNG